MKRMPAASETSLDLLDLKFLPAWVRQGDNIEQYSGFEGEELPTQARPTHHGRGPRLSKRDERGRRGNERFPARRERKGRENDRPPRPSPPHPSELAARALPKMEVRFLPQPGAFAHVLAQIKEGSAAYSVYALARLFLQKPERYEVRVTGQESFSRLGVTSQIALGRTTLEHAAFRLLRDDYYRAEITLHEPAKGNFQSVARERTTGILLGPTNHHAYQPQLRRLYEQRFSRRLSFPDFQRQIEIVSDPALVEQWKEEARKVTTFTTLQEETTRTFQTEAEAERHFRENYLPTLISEITEAVIDGVTSRTLRDRDIARLIENTWASEVRSPSHMMQELATRLRGGGLHIFRHRRGMLFVSPIRPRGIEEAAVSASVRAILEALKASAPIDRKTLAEKIISAEVPAEEAEKQKLALASDLRWLIREGHVIEFNDGSLAQPRSRPQGAIEPPTPSPVEDSPVEQNNEPDVHRSDVIAHESPEESGDPAPKSHDTAAVAGNEGSAPSQLTPKPLPAEELAVSDAGEQVESF